jgi:hypothetical protein
MESRANNGLKYKLITLKNILQAIIFSQCAVQTAHFFFSLSLSKNEQQININKNTHKYIYIYYNIIYIFSEKENACNLQPDSHACPGQAQSKVIDSNR